MTSTIKMFLEKFPSELTIGQLLDQLENEEDAAAEADIRCVRPNCGRLIVQTGRERWVHLAPDGSQNRSCKSAAFDDPKPGDNDQQEWVNWPRALERQAAKPPRRR
jgi:hypothetical protein